MQAKCDIMALMATQNLGLFHMLTQ